jgi:hypothetical protein
MPPRLSRAMAMKAVKVARAKTVGMVRVMINFLGW